MGARGLEPRVIFGRGVYSPVHSPVMLDARIWWRTFTAPAFAGHAIPLPHFYPGFGRPALVPPHGLEPRTLRLQSGRSTD